MTTCRLFISTITREFLACRQRLAEDVTDVNREIIAYCQRKKAEIGAERPAGPPFVN